MRQLFCRTNDRFRQIFCVFVCETYFCTMSGFRLGICDHLLMTLMPTPRADAGGLIIHLVLDWLYRGQARFSSFISCGMIYVRGMKLNSFLPWRDIFVCRLRQTRSLRPIWNEPGKWFIFWCERTVLKHGLFMCLPQTPIQSLVSVKYDPKWLFVCC